MSDPFQVGPFGFDPNDPDFQAAMARRKEQRDEMEIKSLVFKEKFTGLLKNAPREHMEVLSEIFVSLVATPKMANYYYGLVHASMMMRFDTCPMCGEDHAKEMHDGFEKELKRAAGESEGQLVMTTNQMTELPPTLFEISGLSEAAARVAALDYDFRNPDSEELEAIRSLAGQAPPRPLPQHMEEMALQYGVEDAWKQPEDGSEVLEFVGWQCNNCDMIYQSLQDRMLNEPGLGGCTGCIEKTKWG
jgi:hypothetical protein